MGLRDCGCLVLVYVSFIRVAAFDQVARPILSTFPSANSDPYLVMPGPFLKQIQVRYSPPMRSTIRHFCLEEYGVEFDVVHLYACSTPAQDANAYCVWLIPEPFAIMGSKAYKYLGVLPEVLSNLYGNDVGMLPVDIVYPEDYVPASDLLGWAWVYKNYEDKLDVYQQFYQDIDTPNYAHFTIDAGDIELWYTGMKVYVGQVAVEAWRRPYRPPTLSCYGRLENVFRDWREWAMQ